METSFADKANILAELWVGYRDDEQFRDFVAYNDMGLPLAFGYAEGFVSENEMVKKFIEETFSLLLDGLGINDTGFESLTELLS